MAKLSREFMSPNWQLYMMGALHTRKKTMADLLVRGVDEAVVRALKKQADANGRSDEAEHLEVLKAVLSNSEQRSFVEALIAVPNVGLDEDFQRVSSVRATKPDSD
jgi:antitoxin FitA